MRSIEIKGVSGNTVTATSRELAEAYIMREAQATLDRNPAMDKATATLVGLIKLVSNLLDNQHPTDWLPIVESDAAFVAVVNDQGVPQ